jgi:hypothetical protein
MDLSVDYRRFRNGSRIDYKATVMIKSSDDTAFHYATMHNFSNDGMYCCSGCALKPHTIITIRFDDQPFKYGPKTFLGEIRRCEKLDDDDNGPLFGLGIKIMESFTE